MKYVANIMSCVFLISSVVTNVSGYYNVWGGENNFFMYSKRRHFIERPLYDVYRIPYFHSFWNPFLFWFGTKFVSVVFMVNMLK